MKRENESSDIMQRINNDHIVLCKAIRMPLVEADKLLTKSVSHKLIDMSSYDYQELLSNGKWALVVRLSSEGRTADIADRMVSAIEALRGDSNDVIYAVEVNNKEVLAPDPGIIISTMNEHYNIKREVMGFDPSKHCDNDNYMYLEYTSVIVGVILLHSELVD